MTILASPAALALFQTGSVLRDTVLVRPILPVRSGADQFFFYVSGVTSLLTLLLLVAVLVALFWIRRSARVAGRRVDELMADLRPLLRQAAATSESVRVTADLVQQEVAFVRDGVHEAGVRVRRTVGDLADRMDEFNHLLGKVHQRTDAVVAVAGAALEGIAWGADKLRARKPKRARKKS